MARTIGILLGIFFSSCFLSAQTKNILFPKILEQGKTISEFIPIDWKIRDTISGDFNKDNLQDFALVIESKIKFITNDSDCFSTEPFYPKILFILFRHSDKSLHLSTAATKLFGDCNWGIQGQDPFEKLSTRKNSLGISFSEGGTIRNIITYYFGFQNRDWYLIGADTYRYWAGHSDGQGAVYNESINFLTNSKEIYDEDPKGKKSNYKKMEIEKTPLFMLIEVDGEKTHMPFEEGM